MLKMKPQHRKQGNREHVQCVQCTVCTDETSTVYSTRKWERIVRTVVQYVLWCHTASIRMHDAQQVPHRLDSHTFFNSSVEYHTFHSLQLNKSMSTKFTNVIRFLRLSFKPSLPVWVKKTGFVRVFFGMQWSDFDLQWSDFGWCSCSDLTYRIVVT